MPAFVDLTGHTYGRMTVKGIAGKKGRRILWHCVCECGNTKDVGGDSLRTGNTQSCGCLFKEAVTKHGDYLDPVYAVWGAMLARCSNPSHEHWDRYGGRGIKVDERFKDYSTFAKHMGKRPEGGCLERKDNDGPYSPENCVWASRLAQARNTSGNRPIKIGNTTKLLVEWCEFLNLNYGVVVQRLHRGWSIKRALTTTERGFISRQKAPVTLVVEPAPPD